jgi:hypothetical protein
MPDQQLARLLASAQDRQQLLAELLACPLDASLHAGGRQSEASGRLDLAERFKIRLLERVAVDRAQPLDQR